MAESASTVNMDDIVFENRNKSYGAYELRKIYEKHVNTAVAVSVALFLLFAFMPAIVKLLKGEEVVEKSAPKKVRYTDLAPPPPIDQNTPPPPKLEIPPPVKTVIKFLPPKVTKEEVREEEEMPTVEEVKNNDTGSENVIGETEVTFEAPPAAIVEPEAPVEQVYTIVEQMPEFPGGQDELLKYLGKKIKYPAIATRMGVEGTVFVNFIVSKEGRIDEVNVVKGISKECDEEAARVIKGMPDWKPGRQNGRSVPVRYTLPVRFKLDQ